MVPQFDIELDDIAGSASGLPSNLIRNAKNLLETLADNFPAQHKMLASEVIKKSTGNRYAAEAEAWASVIGCDSDDILIANCNYDLSCAGNINLLCSVLALPTSNGPIIGRNLDWFPVEQIKAATCLLKYHRSGKHIFIISGCPGSIGVIIEISVKGFALAINAVGSQAPFQIHKKPVLFKLRETLEGALSYEEALEDLSREPLTSPALITIVGSSNQQMACVERIPNDYSVRGPHQGRLVVANDFRAFDVKLGRDMVGESGSRFNWLSRTALSNHSEEQSVTNEDMFNVLSGSPLQLGCSVSRTVMRPMTGEIVTRV